MCKPKEFAAQITLSMDHCWGIVRALVDMLLKLEDGKFLLIKDPNKDLLWYGGKPVGGGEGAKIPAAPLAPPHLR